ncbi:MAG: glutamate--tRNA ligase [bacterium]
MTDIPENNLVRVRFAPSPTGYLHIGGARTALFNWLYARKNGGKSFLRIEDTDRERSSPEMVDEILSNLRWLGLDWDGEVVYQSRNLDNYKAKAQALLDDDKAYQCFCEKSEQDDKGQESAKCDCYLLTVKEKEERIRQGANPAIRFWVPAGSTSVDDLVYGSLEFENAEIDDFIILRADGTPTYHLAVVVDDHEMEISHVIRGDDHLTNTPKQILLYYVFGWEPPKFAHLPLILGPDKKRLSKRHGANSISEYSKSGILPEALMNYLSLLGWSPGGDKEIMTSEELLDLFSLQRVSRKSAVFDPVKLEWVNSEYIGKYEIDELIDLVLPYLKEEGLVNEEDLPDKRDYLKSVLSLFKPRMKTLKDLARYGKYFFKDPEKYDGSALKKYWTPETKNYLSDFKNELAQMEEFAASDTENSLRTFATRVGIQAAKLIHPIRIVLTGYAVSPGLFEMMEILGKEVVLRRIEEGVSTI